MNAVLRCLVAGLATGAVAASLPAAELRVIAWNVEDTGSWVKANEARLRQLAGQGFDLWGLSEVQEENFTTYLKAVNEGAKAAGLGAAYKSVDGKTGGRHRLMIIYDADRFEKLEERALSGLQATRSSVGRFSRAFGDHPPPSKCWYSDGGSVIVGTRDGPRRFLGVLA